MTVLLSSEEKTDDARASAQSGHCPETTDMSVSSQTVKTTSSAPFFLRDSRASGEKRRHAACGEREK